VVVILRSMAVIAACDSAELEGSRDSDEDQLRPAATEPANASLSTSLYLSTRVPEYLHDRQHLTSRAYLLTR